MKIKIFIIIALIITFSLCRDSINSFTFPEQEKGPIKPGGIYDWIGPLLKDTSKKVYYNECGEFGRSRKEIIDTITKHLPDLRDAYKKRTTINIKLAGSLLVQIKILNNGSVRNTSVISQSTNDTIFNNQILGIIRKFNFGKSVPCDTLLVIQYPFIFGDSKLHGNETRDNLKTAK